MNMIRSFTVAIALVASISVAHAADDYQIESAEQCTGVTKTLTDTMAASKDSLPAAQLAEAEESIKMLNDDCAKGDLKMASEHATAARQSLAAEN